MLAQKNNDYRNTDKCPVLKDVNSKKLCLENRIKTEHERVKIVYNFVKDKNNYYFREFARIYNEKCAYCGVRAGITDIDMFEVDHFICESSFERTTDGKAMAGEISNLVFSCYSCNRGKSNLYITPEYIEVLNPNTNSISKVFCRDENYYINIRTEYSEDKFIKDFYKKLRFGNEFRRLDYLLLELQALITESRSNNSALAEKLQQCFGILLTRRNRTLSSEL